MPHPAIAPGNVAVITGAALGIGQALARRCAAEGMRVAMIDNDHARLEDARADIGEAAIGIACDVSDIDALEAARAQVDAAWGKAASLLVNNAVTRIGGDIWGPMKDWRRALEVNTLGVVNGVRIFAPAMLDAGHSAAIVNVGSKQGITNPPGRTVYNMAKAAVRTYTEALEHDLRERDEARVSAHLLVPGWTTTGTAEHKAGAWRPDQVVDYLFAALDRGSFYVICPDDEVTSEMDRKRILWAAEDITEDRPPLSRWHPDWRDAFVEQERK